MGIERIESGGPIQPIVAWITQGGGTALATQIVKALTVPSLEELEIIKRQVIAQIEGQNWTDEPLSDQDKHLIGMAVSATAMRD